MILLHKNLFWANVGVYEANESPTGSRQAT